MILVRATVLSSLVDLAELNALVASLFILGFLVLYALHNYPQGTASRDAQLAALQIAKLLEERAR